GGAVPGARRRATPPDVRGGGRRGTDDRLPQRRHRRVRPGCHGGLLLPRGEHPPPGRAPRDRGGDRPRSRPPADPDRRGRGGAAHARTRAEPAQRLARARAAARVHGVRTNVPLLLEVLRQPEFVAGRFDTHFVGTRVVPDRPPTAAEQEADRVHAVAVALWQQERRRAEAPVLRGIPSGWRNNPSQPQEVGFTTGEVTITVQYRVRSRERIDVVVDGAAHEASVLDSDAREVVLLLAGVRGTCRIVARDDVHWAHSTLGSSELREVPRFPPPAREAVR